MKIKLDVSKYFPLKEPTPLRNLSSLLFYTIQKQYWTFPWRQIVLQTPIVPKHTSPITVFPGTQIKSNLQRRDSAESSVQLRNSRTARRKNPRFVKKATGSNSSISTANWRAQQGSGCSIFIYENRLQMRRSRKFVQKQAQLTKLISVKTVTDVLREQASVGKQKRRKIIGATDAATLSLLRDLFHWLNLSDNDRSLNNGQLNRSKCSASCEWQTFKLRLVSFSSSSNVFSENAVYFKVMLNFFPFFGNVKKLRYSDTFEWWTIVKKGPGRL